MKTTLFVTFSAIILLLSACNSKPKEESAHKNLSEIATTEAASSELTPLEQKEEPILTSKTEKDQITETQDKSKNKNIKNKNKKNKKAKNKPKTKKNKKSPIKE